MKYIRYLFEAFFSCLLYVGLKLLPLKVSSALGSKVACAIGPKTRIHRVADYNLSRAMPELSNEDRQNYLLRMWDNLGRVFCEYPHLNSKAMLDKVIDVKGDQHLRDAIDSGKPVFIISGHLGNWELAPVVSAQRGMPLHLLYRAANNPVVDYLLARMRKPYTLGLHDKGPKAARAIVKAIKNREPTAMLVDQKTNDGIEVEFFGEMAMTNDAIAHIVLKHKALIIPSRCIRLEGCQFRCEVEAPMQFELKGDLVMDTQSILRSIHAKLEDWIREDPAQWFWVHKRWPHSKAMAKQLKSPQPMKEAA